MTSLCVPAIYCLLQFCKPMTSKNSHSRRLSGTNLGCNKDKDFFPLLRVKKLKCNWCSGESSGSHQCACKLALYVTLSPKLSNHLVYLSAHRWARSATDPVTANSGQQNSGPGLGTHARACHALQPRVPRFGASAFNRGRSLTTEFFIMALTVKPSETWE